MAIYVTAKSPMALWRAIKKGIDDGEIVTWKDEIRSGKMFLTHFTEQHDGGGGQRFKEAWLYEEGTIDEQLKIHYLQVEGKQKPVDVYGIYHGRFIEMILRHFPARIGVIAVSSKKPLFSASQKK